MFYNQAANTLPVCNRTPWEVSHYLLHENHNLSKSDVIYSMIAPLEGQKWIKPWWTVSYDNMSSSVSGFNNKERVLFKYASDHMIGNIFLTLGGYVFSNYWGRQKSFYPDLPFFNFWIAVGWNWRISLFLAVCGTIEQFKIQINNNIVPCVIIFQLYFSLN